MNSPRIIWTLAERHFRMLARSPMTLAIILIPGIVLYSVFTWIFSGPAGRPFRVAVVDEDRSAQSAELIQSLRDQEVKVITTENEEPDGIPLTTDNARRFIREKGEFRVAVVIPTGFGKAPTAMAGPAHQGVVVYFDETMTPEADILVGLLQMAAGRNVIEKFLGLAPADGGAAHRMLVHVDRRGVSLSRMTTDSRHTFLAAIVPMFLLFLSAGSGRTLLLEISGGAIRRQLAAPIEPWHIVGGQLLFCFLLAMAQCYIMYVYAWLVFGVAVWTMGWPLFLLTAATSLATTGLGLLIGSFCHNVEQLDAVGMVVCLAMSAIGGSMVPRWIMPEYMKKLGLLTINGWAYDGYLAIIRNEGLRSIGVVCAVLLCMAAAFACTGSVLLTRRLRA